MRRQDMEGIVTTRLAQDPRWGIHKRWRRNFSFFGFFCVAAFLIFWNVALTYVMIDKLHMNDFGKFYYSIVSFLKDGDMYGPNPATFVIVSPLYGQQFWNLNPPHFHLILLPLGYLSAEMALTVWAVLNLMALIASLQLIGQELNFNPTKWQSRILFLAFLAFCGTSSFFLTGQLSFLLLLPITLAWVYARHNKWNHSGLALGLACSVKPFLLIFAPYFIMKKQYDALRNLLLMCILIYIAGLVAAGPQVYGEWLDKIRLINWSWASMNASIHGWLARSFSENPTYAIVTHLPHVITPLWFALSSLLGLITFGILYKDRDTAQAIDRAFAFLLIGAILISPLGWIYYLFFPLGPLFAILPEKWKVWKTFRQKASPFKLRASIALLVLAGGGFLIPLNYAFLFQPHPGATLTIGSIYFWSALAIWLSLVCEWNIEKFGVPAQPMNNLTRHSPLVPKTVGLPSLQRNIS